MNLQELNKILVNSFPNVEFFEEEHKYVIDGDIVFPSVSTFVKDFYKEFDKEGISKRYSDSRGFSQEDVLNAWEGNAKLSTDNGSDVHLFAEDYAYYRYFDVGDRPHVTCIKCLGVIDFYNSLPPHIVPVALELVMYLKQFGIVGTTDIVLFNIETKTFIIADFKTNETLFETGFDNDLPLKIIPESEGLTQNNFGKYSVQVNLYQYMFEKGTGYEVSDRWIVHLTKGKKLFAIHQAKDLQKHIEKYLKKYYERPV